MITIVDNSEKIQQQNTVDRFPQTIKFIFKLKLCLKFSMQKNFQLESIFVLFEL